MKDWQYHLNKTHIDKSSLFYTFQNQAKIHHKYKIAPWSWNGLLECNLKIQSTKKKSSKYNVLKAQIRINNKLSRVFLLVRNLVNKCQKTSFLHISSKTSPKMQHYINELWDTILLKFRKECNAHLFYNSRRVLLALEKAIHELVKKMSKGSSI